MNAEVVRWTLEQSGIPFREEPHAPVFHLLAFKRRRIKARYVALVFQNRRYADVAKIMEFFKSQAASQHLFLHDATEQGFMDKLWPQFHKELGGAAARWIYAHMLPNKQVMGEILTQGVPRMERIAYRYGGYSLLTGLVKKALNINAQTSTKMADQFQGVLDQTDQLLRDGRPYLLGDRFSVIDILFCANGAPCVLEPGYGAPLPTLQQAPPAMQQIVTACRDRPSGQFIQRIYEQHRLAKKT
jgi:glutathione S-transferase